MCIAFFLMLPVGTNAQENRSDKIDQEILLFHNSMKSAQQTRSGINPGRTYYNLLLAGPLEHDQYFYVDTKIPFMAYPAPQVHVTGYNYGHPNKAIKFTLGWYHWAGTWYWTQYRNDIGYYNPSRIRLGTYDDNGVVRVRIEIANDGIYWSSYSFSATDHQGDASFYEGWTYHSGQMPEGTGNITTVEEYPYVKIGTSGSPTTLIVAGDIVSREIRIEANAGADFVFDEGYSLRPLKDVEQFITENKHLPDIAPADSMVRNGVSMGEMQIKLLQKIEELTLYIIEQEKRLNEQGQRIFELENRKSLDE
ncbi:MAG: hypothetical protein LBQ60_22130 [Bacteroidales bacterium]|jgi:hypothetical protein|nr:hypothetical protein [Bacteroidales bacterium]